jgi:hypothetical protein
MRRARYFDVTFEMREVLIVRGPANAGELCEICAPQIGLMVSSEAAAAISGVPMRMLFKLLEAGLIHFRENKDGSVLICVNSIAHCDAAAGFSLGDDQEKQT